MPLTNRIDKEETAARAELTRAARELKAEHAIRAWEFLQVLNAHDSNNTTPVEDFIVELPSTWARYRGIRRALTPDDIVGLINDESDGLRTWFDDAVLTARTFRRFYGSVLDKEDA